MAERRHDAEPHRGFAWRRTADRLERREVDPLDGEERDEQNPRRRAERALRRAERRAGAHEGEEHEGRQDGERRVAEEQVEQVRREAPGRTRHAMMKDDVLGRLDRHVRVERSRCDHDMASARDRTLRPRDCAR